MSRIVIALGGNALGDTPAEQQARIAAAAPSLVGLIAQGHEIIVSHGNGPQVGAINLAFDTAADATGRVPRMPLPECTAMSQGYIGYHLQQGLLAELRRVGMPWHVASVVTQVEVDPRDPAFERPTKPIGAFYDEASARSMMAEDPTLVMTEDAGRGWRVVVPSPRPVSIVERDSILNLLDHEFIVIACGGGGVPVVRDAHGDLHGVPAVIDKDFASASLAEAVGADYLFILTAVDRVAIGFGTPEQRDLDELDLATAQRYIDEGQFGAGSMLPKVRAAMQFAASGTGRRAVICSLENAPLAMRGLSGTVVRADTLLPGPTDGRRVAATV
ncbi:carbamate kinase [Actinotalea sp. M2MS4P-6]|uniref:carbamate kinase n=1 Tax=Actinotalea sp. M2MS4P-6 TaxID=2983762 RepID=UPI0021E50DF8|nr:carbamate kinase [Actinotalea sp. M2MS4P-6]MCV2395717.1 carbamate kinase [Actinotalea sp. M2MS4P-6]